MRSFAILAMAALLSAPGRAASVPQDADVFAKRGVYVETETGVSELRNYAEAKPLDASELRAYRYAFPALAAPQAKVVLSFVINMPGSKAESWVAASQLLFIVGREVEEGRGNNYSQMTPKISRMKPSVYLVQSAEFDRAWLKDAYARLARSIAQRPEAFIALIVQDVSGQPRKLYPVKVFGD